MINKVRSTHKELTSKYSRLTTKALGFTMAEILLSLTIIGVVAAITLPSLTGNINERTWNTQKKALYSRMSQAVALMPALNGYGSTDNDAAETFITSGLSKVLKINNICGFGSDGSTLFDCGFSSKIITADASKIDLPRSVGDLNPGMLSFGTISLSNTMAAAFETANGESVLTFYNPRCTAANVLISDISAAGNFGYYTKDKVCANFLYDLNGKKGPNTVGKDIGAITVIYPSDSMVVMPIGAKTISGKKIYSEAASACKGLDEGQYRLPNVEEWLSLFYNRALMGNSLFASSSINWSSNVIDSDNAYGYGVNFGMKYPQPKSEPQGVACVQRN